jgi:hypothetical protein
MSNLFRNVPFLGSLEVSLFSFDLLFRWSVRRSEALRRGLCGAFRAKRRRTLQRVPILAIDSTYATSFSAHPPAHPHPLNVPLPALVQTAPVPFPNTSPESAAAPSAGISLASLGSNFFPHCGAGAPWLLLRDITARVSLPADSSTPASPLRPPVSASALSLAPKPLLDEVPSYSSLSSSAGPPQEVAI